MNQEPPPPTATRLAAALTTATLLLAALVTWSFAASATAPARRVLLFAAAVGILFAALRRHPWPAMAVASVMALAMAESGLQTLDGWGALFVATGSTGAAMGLRRYAGIRWIGASLPFWVFANSATWIMTAALGLSFWGLASVGVGPTLPGRRRRTEGQPQPHLAQGALGPVVARVYPSGRRSRVLTVVTIIFAVLVPVLAAASAFAVEAAAFAIASAIIASTFAFSSWFGQRAHVRIDDTGLHGRVLFGEHTVRWTEVVSLQLRYVILPAFNARLVYYCVRSPSREVSFPSSMQGATELQASIESATGLAWPEPEMDATL